jgi:hypothetical protein
LLQTCWAFVTWSKVTSGFLMMLTALLVVRVSEQPVRLVAATAVTSTKNPASGHDAPCAGLQVMVTLEPLTAAQGAQTAVGIAQDTEQEDVC